MERSIARLQGSSYQRVMRHHSVYEASLKTHPLKHAVRYTTLFLEKVPQKPYFQAVPTNSPAEAQDYTSAYSQQIALLFQKGLKPLLKDSERKGLVLQCQHYAHNVAMKIAEGWTSGYAHLFADLIYRGASFEEAPILINQYANPTHYFSFCTSQFSIPELKEALEQLNKGNHVYAVGSGSGAFESFAEQEEQFPKVTCIDPDPASWSGIETGSSVIFKKPDYPLLTDVPKIDENATLFLISPGNTGITIDTIYDMEAVQQHPWQQILIIYEKDGTSGGEALHKWINEQVKGGLSDYKVKFENNKWARNSWTGNLTFSCVVLEKNFQGSPTIMDDKEHKPIPVHRHLNSLTRNSLAVERWAREDEARKSFT